MAAFSKNTLVKTRKVTVLLYALNNPVCMCEVRAEGWTISFRCHIPRTMTDWYVSKPGDKEELRIQKGRQPGHSSSDG